MIKEENKEEETIEEVTDEEVKPLSQQMIRLGGLSNTEGFEMDKQNNTSIPYGYGREEFEKELNDRIEDDIAKRYKD